MALQLSGCDAAPMQRALVQCPKCGGNLFIESDDGAPGLFDVICWLNCGHRVGVVTSRMLMERYGVSRERATWAEGRIVTAIWELRE